MKKPRRIKGKIMYHVFKAGVDYFPDTLREAREVVRQWITSKQGCDSWRIYKMIGEDHEEYIDGQGIFPF